MAAIKPGDFKEILRRAEQLKAGDIVNPVRQDQPELTAFDRLMLKRSVRITIPIADIHSRELRYVAEELHILANELDWMSRDTDRRERSILFDAETRATWCHWNIRDRAWRGRSRRKK